MPSDPEVVVIGAGPNGLAAACVLARAGLRVLVLEAHPDRPGGALASDAGTLPGFVHDVGAAFFPFAQASPAFRDLALDQHGLRWTFAPIDSAHPAPDGSVAVLARNLDLLEHNFGSAQDGSRMRRVCEEHARIEPALIPAMLETFPAIRPALGLLPFAIFRLAATFMRSGASLSKAWFRSAAAQRVIPGLALHTDVGPDDTFGAGIGYMPRGSGAPRGRSTLTTRDHNRQGKVARIPDTLLTHASGLAKRASTRCLPPPRRLDRQLSDTHRRARTARCDPTCPWINIIGHAPLGV